MAETCHSELAQTLLILSTRCSLRTQSIAASTARITSPLRLSFSPSFTPASPRHREYLNRRLVAFVVAFLVQRAAVAVAAGARGDHGDALAVRMPGEAVGVGKLFLEERGFFAGDDI